jgi:hypothetical protein
MFLIDTQNKKAISLERKSFSELKLSEPHDLQEWIVDNPNILGENLLIIQKEFAGFADTNERLDLLALDENGRLVVIENKRDDSGRDVVWQALKYVSYCATLTKSEICEIYQRYLGTGGIASEKISEFYDGQEYESIKLNPADGDQRIIFVAANFRREATSTVLWLRDHDVDITCIKVTPYEDGDKLYLDAEQILPIKDIGDYQIRLTAKKQEVVTSSKEEAIRHKLRYRFWERALPELRTKTGIYINISPTKDNWLYCTSGYSGVTVSSIIKKDGARAELLINSSDKDRNKKIFNELKEKKTEVETLFEGKLDWQELPDKKACRICVHYNEYGLEDEEHWNEIIDFLADSMARLISAIKPFLDDAVKG